MIVDQVHVHGLAVLETEHNAPVARNLHTPLSFPVAVSHRPYGHCFVIRASYNATRKPRGRVKNRFHRCTASAAAQASLGSTSGHRTVYVPRLVSGPAGQCGRRHPSLTQRRTGSNHGPIPKRACPRPAMCCRSSRSGGPERREEVIPYLENVMRGRNVQRVRMQPCNPAGIHRTREAKAVSEFPGASASLHFSPRGEAKCVRGPAGRGAPLGARNMACKVFTNHESRNTGILRHSLNASCLRATAVRPASVFGSRITSHETRITAFKVFH